MQFILLLAALLLPMRAASAAPQVFPSSAGALAVETIAGGLAHPWSLAFLPDGRMLVTERPGRLRIVTRAGQLSPPFAGVPEVYAQSQAGLMDVILGRDFATNHTIYFCYAERADGGGGRIAVANARLEDNGRAPRLVAVKIIFRQQGPASRGLNIGCRMVQAEDGNLFVIPRRSFFRGRDGADARQSHRQNYSHPPGRQRAARQSVRRQTGRAAGNLGLRPAQCRRPRVQSGRRRLVGAGARPQRRRRNQHHREGQELRLAQGQLRRQLRRHAGRQRQGADAGRSRIRSGTGRRRSRRRAWRSIPPISFPAGRAV